MILDQLQRLASLLRTRDAVDAQIAALTGRSARPGDVGEFIASLVFDIALADSATQAGHDGVFRSGPLRGRTVNVKIYGDAGAGIDISPHPCDFYLILTGPARPGTGVRHHSWQITAAYLFDTATLISTLRTRGTKIGIATSIRKADLQDAQIYPARGRLAPLRLEPDQDTMLSMFS